MSILLHCNLCGFEVADVKPVMLELQHWLIISHPRGLCEEHFCRKCRPIKEARITEQREEMAQRQENE